MVQPTYTGPAHPIGYIEVQVGWIGEKTTQELSDMIDELRAKALRENPGYQQSSGLGQGARVETTFDGAGVPHFTMYMGFEPIHKAAEPLDPRNMNDAPKPQVGMPTVEDSGVSMGYREQQFGRGT